MRGNACDACNALRTGDYVAQPSSMNDDRWDISASGIGRLRGDSRDDEHRTACVRIAERGGLALARDTAILERRRCKAFEDEVTGTLRVTFPTNSDEPLSGDARDFGAGHLSVGLALISLNLLAKL